MTGVKKVPEIKEKIKKNKILGEGIFLLILLIAIFSYLNRDFEDLKEGRLVFKAGNTQLAVFTIEDLKKFPAVEKEMVVRTSQGSERHFYTMTPLLGVLDKIDPELTEKYEKIVTKAIDNYVSGVNMSEVLEPDNVYLAYLDHGKPLPTKNGREGSLQIVICQDQFGQRFVKYLVCMEFLN